MNTFTVNSTFVWFAGLTVILLVQSFVCTRAQTTIILDLPESWPDLAPPDDWPPTVAGWQTVLPACPEVTDILSVANCINSFGPYECFPVESVDSLSTCLLGKFSNNDTGIVVTTDIVDTEVIGEAVVDCLDPMYDCYVEQTKTALEGLPVCVRASTRKLALCLTQNALTCSVDCLGTEWDDVPFTDNLVASDLTLCSGIQNSLVDPLCEWMQCCPPCLPYMEEAVECVVNEVLDRGSGLIFDTACDLVCVDHTNSTTANGHDDGGGDEEGGGNTRSLMVDHAGNQTNADEIFQTCRTLVPGLYGDDLARERLLARSNYFDCLVEELIKVTEINFATAVPTTLPTSSSRGNRLFATTAAGSSLGSWWSLITMVLTAGTFAS